MMTFVRVVVPGGGKAGGGRAAAGGQQQQQQDGQLLKAWWERLGVTFQPPALVLLRGPGTTPEVSRQWRAHKVNRRASAAGAGVNLPVHDVDLHRHGVRMEGARGAHQSCGVALRRWCCRRRFS